MTSNYPDLLTDKDVNAEWCEFLAGKIRGIVEDPATAAKLIPDHLYGQRRPPFGTNYYETYNNPKVSLVDLKATPITQVTERGIETADGEQEFDIIVWATGFDFGTGALNRMGIRGRDGLALEEYWADGPSTYLGVACRGFPNFFFPGGPHGSTGNNPRYAGDQVDFVMDVLIHMREAGDDLVEVEAEAEEYWSGMVNTYASTASFSEASYFFGANIPGKPIRYLLNPGGRPKLHSAIARAIDGGFDSFAFERVAGAPSPALARSTFGDVTSAEQARSSVLDSAGDLEELLVARVADVVRQPSVSGTDGENEAQAYMAGLFIDGGLDVDHWQLDLETLTAHPEFPGMEVPRAEAWGLVGRLPGTGDGPTLMLNGHIDVVPTGDPEAWSASPFSGEVRNGRLFGRGACDMKAGLMAAHVAVQAVRRSGVMLRGDVLVASVQGEEDGGLGTFATLQRGWRADACVIPEPTDLDIIPANSGALTFRLRVRGQGDARCSTHRGRQRGRCVLAGLERAPRARTTSPRRRRSGDGAVAAGASIVDRHGAGR